VPGDGLAVVVPVHHARGSGRWQRLDRLAGLVVCLRSLLRAREVLRAGGRSALGEVTLVLVDDGSPEPVGPALPADVRAGVRVERVPVRRGQGAALNRAVRAVGAAAYALTDSDCQVAEDWLVVIEREYLAATGCGGVLGSAGPPWRHRPGDTRWSRWLTDQEGRLAQACFLRDADPRTGTIARLDCRNVWLRCEVVAGGDWFPEDAGAALSGVLSHRLAASGRWLRFAPEMVVRHAAVSSARAQVRTYFLRGTTRELRDAYAAGHRSLPAAFARTYARRHFVEPVRSGVHPGYVALAHGAYWLGLAGGRLRHPGSGYGETHTACRLE
jgi:glycosyltransferase involved in cell wall biosynthesis